MKGHSTSPANGPTASRRPCARAAARCLQAAEACVAGHWQALAAWNGEFLDSAAAYCVVPLALALDVGSTERADGIQYRLGLHQVRCHGDRMLRLCSHWRCSLL